MNEFSPQDWPQVAALFDEGAELPPAERSAWLQALAARAPRLSAPVARLLAAHARHETGDWLALGPALPDAALRRLGSGLAAGQVLGRYRLLARAGQGGMGEVWQAQPLEGPAPHRVALKLPLLARPDSAALARFQREGELLASLRHPHIARLLDAGQADDGTPYLALEWVEGLGLLAWAAQAGLSTAQRLRLFLQVLDAVAYAHSRLVIHRDLKPANILVDESGQVKLLDFGIAKLVQADGAVDATALTRAAGRVLTTAYAAPEQVRGDALTPAADVYALGVLLFELLTGQRPYRVPFSSEAQLEQVVEAADVRRPGSLCTHWPRSVRVDLDAVLGKALQRAPEARYAGAQDFAEDLRRHLAGQPVLAQAPTPAYLLRKALQRHRVAALGVAATVVALLAGGAMAAWQAQQATLARDQATAARDQAIAAHERSRATKTFLLDLIDDAARAGQPLQASQLMARAEQLARQTLAQTPDQLAAVLGIVGESAYAAGDGARGPQLLAEAQRLARSADLQAELGCQQALASTGAAKPDAALALLRRQADDPARDPGVRLRCALTLAQLLVQTGQLQEAEQRVTAVDAQLRDAGPTAWRLRTWVLTLQLYLRADGRAQGLDARAVAQAEQLRAMGRDRNSTALGLYNTWGTLASVSGEPERALQRWAHVVDIATQDDPLQRVAPYHLGMLAQAEMGVGAYAQAQARLQQALEAAYRTRNDAERYRSLCSLGRLAGLQGDDAKARAFHVQAQSVPDHGEPLRGNFKPFCIMGEVESALIAGRLPEAGALLHTVGDVNRLPRPARTGWLALQAELAWRQGDAPLAERLARQWLVDAQGLQADNQHSARTGMALWMLALAERAQGREPEAAAHATQARAHLQATVRPEHRWRRWAGP